MNLRSYFNILRAKRKRKSVIKEYLASHTIRKFELGAELTNQEGWLTTDNRPVASNLYLDVTEKFPFDNDVFDYVYSEHMIEHLT